MRGLVDGDVAEVVVVVDADADTAGLVGDAMADIFVFRYSCTRLKPQPPKPISTNPFPTKIKFPSDQKLTSQAVNTPVTAYLRWKL